MSAADASGASNTGGTREEYTPQFDLRLLEAEEELRQAQKEHLEQVQRAQEKHAAQTAKNEAMLMSRQRQGTMQALFDLKGQAAQSKAGFDRKIAAYESSLHVLNLRLGYTKPGLDPLTRPAPTPAATEAGIEPVNTATSASAIAATPGAERTHADSSESAPTLPALPAARVIETMEGKTVLHLVDDWALAHEAMRFTVWHNGTSYDKALNLHCAEYKNAPRKLQNATKEEKAAAACKFRLSYKRAAVSQVWQLNNDQSHFTHNHGSTKCSRSLMESQLRKYPELAKDNLNSRDGSKNVQLRHGGKRKLPDGTISKINAEIITMDRRALNYRRLQYRRSQWAHYDPVADMTEAYNFMEWDMRAQNAYTNQLWGLVGATGESSVDGVFYATSVAVRRLSLYKSVLVVDGTHGTNSLGWQLVNILAVDVTGKSFSLAMCLLRRKDEETYKWMWMQVKQVYQRRAESTISRDAAGYSQIVDNAGPVTVFTDREIALYKSLERVFPAVKWKVCEWHMNEDVEKFIFSLTSNQYLSEAGLRLALHFSLENTAANAHEWFLTGPDAQKNVRKWLSECWRPLREFHTIEETAGHWAKIETILGVNDRFVQYFKREWQDKAGRGYWGHVKAFTLGQRTTSRVESEHSALKRFLGQKVPVAELALDYYTHAVGQFTAITKAHTFDTPEAFTRSKIKPEKTKKDFVYESDILDQLYAAFSNVKGRVARYALSKCAESYLHMSPQRRENLRKNIPACSHSTFSRSGWPCSHKIALAIQLDKPLEMADFDRLWYLDHAFKPQSSIPNFSVQVTSTKSQPPQQKAHFLDPRHLTRKEHNLLKLTGSKKASDHRKDEGSDSRVPLAFLPINLHTSNAPPG